MNISEIGTTGVIVAIVAGFVIIGFAKGLVRMAFALVALAAGSIAALWGVQKGGSIASILVSNPEPWMSGAVGGILGLAVFFVTRALFGVLLSPISVKDGQKKNGGPIGGLVGLVMGAVFAWLLISGVRYVGTLAEMDWIKAAIVDQTKITEAPEPLFAKLKRGVDSSTLGRIHEQYDLLNDKAKANLAKLTLLKENKVLYTKARATDRPVYDALAQENIRLMLDAQSADLATFIKDGQYAHLLQSNQIKDVAKNPEANVALKALDVEKSLGLVKEPKKEKKAKPEKAAKK